MPSNPAISVLILTKNEERDLPGCLDSVKWSDDVHVFDSESTDRTIQIAQHAEAKIHVRPFDNYAAQRNAALRGIAFKHEWLLILDADERIPPALRDELTGVVSKGVAETIGAFRMRRRDFLGKTWLKYSQLSPFYIRLVRHARCRYEREVNEILKVEGDVADLDQPFDHYPFSKGMTHWLAKHNLYSSMEAEQVIAGRRGNAPFSLLLAFTARDFNERRYHQKELFYRLPARPLLKFLMMYFLRRGLLDGRAGFTYAILQAIYEYMIVLKTAEVEENSPATIRAASALPELSKVDDKL